MNAIKKILTLSIVGSVLIFAGCEEDDTVTVMDKEEAVQTLEQNSQDIEASMEGIEKTEGMQAMETLNGIMEENDPFSELQKSTGYESVIGNLKEVLKPINENHLKRSAEQKFNFDGWVGTYTWQHDKKEWVPAMGEPDDKIIFEFPADPTQDPENNAELTLSDYSEFETTDSLGNTVYVPDTVSASLTVDDEEVLTIDYTLGYDEENEMVTSLSANVDLKPFTWEVSMDENSIEATLTNEDRVVTSFSFDVTFMDNMEDVEKLDGQVLLYNLNLDGWINPHNIEQIEDEETWAEQGWESIDDVIEYVNEQINMTLYHVDGDKIADLKVIKTEESDTELPVQLVWVFKDDSTEPAKKYFENLISYVESILAKYNLEESEL